MKISLALFAVFLFVAGAGAIKCYNCEDCGKPKNSEECGALLNKCLLVVSDGKKGRACSNDVFCNGFAAAGIKQCNDDVQDNCSTCCDTDNCNSAGIASFSIVTMLVVLMLSVFVTK